MTVLDLPILDQSETGLSFSGRVAAFASASVLDRLARLPEESRNNLNELLEEYRNADDQEERKEIISTMVEILLNEPIRVISASDVEQEASTTLEGADASERLKRQAEAFAGNLKRLRGAKGLTQGALAEAANITQPQISYLERGEHRPQEATVKKLAEALGVSPEELLPLG